MIDDNSGTDLFGDPIVAPQEGRGRPEHRWTIQNSNKVLLCFARRLGPKEAALAIGVSVPTLRKYYSSELEKRRAAHLMFEATQLHRLNEAAKGGNITAERELLKAMERGATRQLAADVARGANRAPKPERLGKKAQAQRAAASVSGRFGRRPAPSLLNPSGNA